MFMTHKFDAAKVPPCEYHPAGAITPHLGLALTMTDGRLAVAAGSVKPDYICMFRAATPVEDGTVIPVMRVLDDIIFETEATAALTGVEPGARLTISADGLGVTATEGGACELVSKDGDEAGDAVRIRFAEPAA